MTLSAESGRSIETQLSRHGITEARLLQAFRIVPREEFLPENLREFADADSALPIAAGQAISQPSIVALMIDALELRGSERVLEIGTGSGYAAAILSRLARQVFSIERIEELAEQARASLLRLGYTNVRVRCADGTLGWSENAPYDAIAVAAGGPEIPPALLAQLSPTGRLVMPVGPDESSQMLTLVTRRTDGTFQEHVLEKVRFVPLIGEQGWPAEGDGIQALAKSSRTASVARLVRETAEPLLDLETTSIRPLVDRLARARVVLLGEASHGTSEFYRMRARITKELIHRGFNFVAAEADWPDAARIDDYVLGGPPRSTVQFRPFSRFPTWMWRNEEVDQFIGWLRLLNQSQRDPTLRVGFHGLDLYSLFTSIAAVLGYLDAVDPDAARVARARYGTLTPWQKDPAAYGQAVLVGRYRSSESAVVAMLRELLERRLEYARADGARFFDAAQNARVVADAERYYRAMYYGSVESWNLRDTHMFDTLQSLLSYYGPESRGIVWAHNSHVGNAQATEMSARGEFNIGQLCRQEFGDQVRIVGFGTDHGTVAAASNWDEPMERMAVRPAHPESYERLFHDSGVPAFVLHLRDPKRGDIRDELISPRLERAIGVIYRPETELASHYFQASLPHQFDEFLWFDATRAVEPLGAGRTAVAELPETYPFGL